MAIVIIDAGLFFKFLDMILVVFNFMPPLYCRYIYLYIFIPHKSKNKILIFELKIIIYNQGFDSGVREEGGRANMNRQDCLVAG